MTVDADRGRRRSRRDEILEIAVGLFATRGYHGVSMDDIGAAAGVTGPALYHHFAGKEAMLVAALAPVSERLLEGGRARVAARSSSARRSRSTSPPRNGVEFIRPNAACARTRASGGDSSVRSPVRVSTQTST